jgi:hypothetical protein
MFIKKKNNEKRRHDSAQAPGPSKAKKIDTMRAELQADRVTLIVTDGKGIRDELFRNKKQVKRYRATRNQKSLTCTSEITY